MKIVYCPWKCTRSKASRECKSLENPHVYASFAVAALNSSNQTVFSLSIVNAKGHPQVQPRQDACLWQGWCTRTQNENLESPLGIRRVHLERALGSRETYKLHKSSLRPSSWTTTYYLAKVDAKHSTELTVRLKICYNGIEGIYTFLF